MNNKIGVLILIFFCSYTVISQVGIGTSLPNASAQLEVVSNDKGVLLPKVPLLSRTDATTISNGNVIGLMVYNITNNSVISPGYYYWSGTEWLLFNTQQNVAESITTLVDNNNGTFTYTSENGNQTTFDADGDLVDNNNGTFTYTNAAGDNVDFDAKIARVADNNDGIFTITDDFGDSIDIDVVSYEPFRNSDGSPATNSSVNINYLNGDIGIGLTDPNAKIEIKDSLRNKSYFKITEANSGDVLNIRPFAFSTGQSQFLFGAPTSLESSDKYVFNVGNTDNEDFVIKGAYPFVSEASGDKFRVNKSGEAKISTDNTTGLTVNRVQSGEDISFRLQQADSTQYTLNAGNNKITVEGGGNEQYWTTFNKDIRFTSTKDALWFNSATNENHTADNYFFDIDSFGRALTINNQGDIGINYLNPISKLDLRNTDSTKDFFGIGDNTYGNVFRIDNVGQHFINRLGTPTVNTPIVSVNGNATFGAPTWLSLNVAETQRGRIRYESGIYNSMVLEGGNGTGRISIGQRGNGLVFHGNQDDPVFTIGAFNAGNNGSRIARLNINTRTNGEGLIINGNAKNGSVFRLANNDTGLKIVANQISGNESEIDFQMLDIVGDVDSTPMRFRYSNPFGGLIGSKQAPSIGINTEPTRAIFDILGATNRPDQTVLALSSRGGSTESTTRVLIGSGSTVNSHVKLEAISNPSLNTYSDFRIVTVSEQNVGTVNRVFEFDRNGHFSAPGSVKIGENTNTLDSTDGGTMRYRTTSNSSSFEMYMQTGENTFEWVVIKQNNW